jgi:hypothetical protein
MSPQCLSYYIVIEVEANLSKLLLNYLFTRMTLIKIDTTCMHIS